MKAKEYLQQIKRLDLKIQNRIDEIQMLHDISTKTTTMMHLDGIKTAGNGDRIGNAICGYIEAEEELKKEALQAAQCRREVVKTIEQLPVIEYELLYKIYVQGWTLQEAADNKDRTYTWATTTHSNALKNLQKLLDKRNSE